MAPKMKLNRVAISTVVALSIILGTRVPSARTQTSEPPVQIYDRATPQHIYRGFIPQEPKPLGRDEIPADAQGDGDVFATYHSGLMGEANSNYIIVELGDDASAGSAAASIQFRIGRNFTINLVNGGNDFVAGSALRYDLPGGCADCYKAIPPDDWDDLKLETTSSDGMQTHRVVLVKSYETLLDVTLDTWLDRYYQRVLDLSIDTALRKWDEVGVTRVTDLYYAGQDLGKTGSIKYVNRDTPWCSEFAAYMIRKNGLADVPAGSIGTADLKDYFENKGRRYWASDVARGDYTVKPGDYMSLWQNSANPCGRHSVLFRGWRGGTPRAGSFSPDQEFYTIEGNNGNSVRTTYRKWSDVYFIGKTQ